MPNIPKHPLKLLVIGNGGREHALCWKLAQSSLVEQIYCASGNGGTAQEQKTKNVNIDSHDFAALAQFCRDEQIDLTVVGPENVLAEGIVDYFLTEELRIFGPTKAAARLEWSKTYAKEFMGRHDIPTAKFKICTDYNDAVQTVEKEPWAEVVKVDGLASGKGVYVCNNEQETKEALKQIFQDRQFGQAGDTVVLEEKLNGEEISLFLLSDGKQFLPMVASQDNKRRFDQDRGPNTGGMGAISPPASYERYEQLIEESIIEPLLGALKKEGIDYKGVLYLGLLLDKDKNTGLIVPKILEFNCRFGDPETQVVLPRLQSDLLPVLWACTEGKLAEIALKWKKEACCSVIAVTKDYPAKSAQGQAITLPKSNKAIVFHAGTKRVDGKLLTAGGRILAVTAVGNDMETAAEHVYDYLSGVQFEDMDHRKDIGRIASKTR